MKLIKHIVRPYITGLHLGSYTYLFSNVLDHTISRKNTMELIQKNPKLYIDGTVSNFINLLGLSPMYYIIVDNFFITDKSVELQLLKWFGMGMLFFRPNSITFQMSIATISLFNSLVHCPPLKNLRLKYLPFLVVPNDHLIHHEVLTAKYASPILNVDYLVKNTPTSN